MSFFDEPPPLDCDIPPPLDDKTRENDFDLDEEEIIIEDNRNLELPDLPTDFNVFSSVATDENVSYSHPPPEILELVVESSPPPDDKEGSKSDSPETCDVAEEKESFNTGAVVSQHEMDRLDKKLHDLSISENTGITHAQAPIVEPEIDYGKTFNTPAVPDVIKSLDDDIPLSTPDEVFQSSEDSKDDAIVDQSASEQSACPDDDFEDFVEASSSDEKPKIFLGDDSEFEDFAGFTTHDNIPEPIPELKLDDEDNDDFNDFETAIPLNRPVESAHIQAQLSEEAPSEIVFEADFSAFNAFSATNESSFDEFQDFKEAEPSTVVSQLNNEDDDDFGDFSDFTSAPTSATIPPAPLESQPVAFVKPANVNAILDMMFPPTSACSSEKPEPLNRDYASDQQVIKSDNFVSKFNDFDSTLALGYHYSNSKASQTLVKALGIDTRNILLGPQWTSSSASSNMPRFAANLSFSPIEPMKPSSSHSSSIVSSTEPKPPLLQPTKLPTEVVPEAEFDWNSAGLVNPLDGPQPKPQQSNEVEPIVIPQPAASPAHPFEDESSLHVVDQDTQVFEAEAKANAGHKPELGDALSSYQWSSEVGHFGGPIASSNIVVRERTIKLPETHIFTPVKGSSPVAREVISRDVSPAPDFTKGSVVVKDSIVVKEYHDVEYSLEPKKRIDSDNDFDDFQSAQPTTVDPPLVPLNLLEPQKVESLTAEIKWPEPGNVAQSASNELDFLETSPIPAPLPAPPKINFSLPLAPSISSRKKEQEFLKPVIGTSPTEHNGTADDDDFNDFQAAPTQPQKKAPSNDPITLSPARLQAHHSKQQTAWISSLDDDEINRIEAAFPKCKPDKKPTQKSNDEDDWTDFVGVTQPPTSLPYTQSKLPSMISSNTMHQLSKFSNGDGDDWSDFVSVPPKMASSRSSGAISSQFQSKPQFSSWNQPIAKPYVNHSTSFLTNDTKNQSQQFTSSNYPYVTDKMSRPSMTITNNFSYGFNHPETVGTNQNHQPRPNGISTILPELDFAMPKHLINLPRGGSMDPGKK